MMIKMMMMMMIETEKLLIQTARGIQDTMIQAKL